MSNLRKKKISDFVIHAIHNDPDAQGRMELARLRKLADIAERMRNEPPKTLEELDILPEDL